MSKRSTGLMADRILSVLGSANSVLSGHTVAKRLAERGAPVAPSHAFRILNDLCDKGLVHRVELASGYVSGPPHRQANFVCAICGSLTCIDMPSHFEAIAILAHRQGMVPFRIMIEAAGTCKLCRRAQAAPISRS